MNPAPVADSMGKRLKGLEPSTFCMASRRSSQLSYSRTARRSSISAGPGALRPGDFFALLPLKPLEQREKPGDVLLLGLDDPVDRLLGVLVGERQQLLLVAVDRQELL